MNLDLSWQVFFLAIQIVFSLQLLIASFINFLELKVRNLLLVHLSFILISTYNIVLIDSDVYVYTIKSLLTITSFIYFAPVFYLYLKSFLVDYNTLKKEVVKHYFPPFIIALTNYLIYEIPYYWIILAGFVTLYTLFSFRLYIKIKKAIHGTMKVRFLWFSRITLAYLTIEISLFFAGVLANYNIPFFSDFQSTIILLRDEYFHYSIMYIHLFVLCVYMITEIPRFKKFFITKSLREHGINHDEMTNLKTQFDALFQTDKVYLDSNLSLDSLSKKMNLEKSLVSKFLKEKYSKGFHEIVNQYRIQEFKKLLLEETYKNYDLVGLAKESGFKSKATFFRVFKEMEGVTPNQYKKNITS